MKRVGVFLMADPEGGGTFQYQLAVLEAVNALPREKYNVFAVYENDLWMEYIKEYKVESIKLPSDYLSKVAILGFQKFKVPTWLKRILISFCTPIVWRLSCDLLIYPHPSEWSSILRVPALTTIYDLMHRYETRFPEVFEDGEYEMRETLYTNMCKYTRGVLVDSEVGKQHVIECYGLNEQQIFVLPYIAPKYIWASKHKSDLLENHELPRKFLFYPAQFWMHKNHKNLLKAAAQVKQIFPDIHLVFVGAKKNGYENTIYLIDELNLQANTTILGYVSNDYMVELYKKARALIMPTFLGPTNIPPLEAFELGCPVATSNVYGIPKQVGDAALLFNPESVDEIANCIVKLWNDDLVCNELSVRGKQKATEWGQLQFNRRLLQIIENIC